MKLFYSTLGSLLLGFGLISTAIANNEVEGPIQSVDPEARTITVQGITFEITDSTRYDDGLRRFEDMHEGQVVEVDFHYLDGRHIATEVELD